MKKLIAALLLFPILTSYSQKWEKKYDYVDDCVCGLSKLAKDSKVGYVNKNGVEIIKLQYADWLTFSEGYKAVKLGTKWLYLDGTGRIIAEAIFDDGHNFRNGLAIVAKSELFGYINTTGELVITYPFSKAGIFSEGLASAANTQGLWGFIDKKGNWVIKPVYNLANAFANGEARVMKDDKVNKLVHE